MTLRLIVAAGVYLSLIPLAGATGCWTEPVAAAFFADVEAPGMHDTGAPRALTAQQDAGPPTLPVRAARIERRDATPGLGVTVTAVGHAETARAWLAWSAPAVARAGGQRGWDRSVGRCVLDEDGRLDDENTSFENTTSLVILVRLTTGKVDRVVFTDGRCTIDAGSRTVYWLEHVRPAESVMLLADLVRREAAGSPGDEENGHRDPGHQALIPLALTDDASVDPVLDGFVAPSSPRWLRRDAAFWLGAARGAQGARVIIRLARTDADTSFREHLTFVLTLTGDDGLETLVDLARHDASPPVRSQALFWLGQKAGERAVGTLRQAVDNDPDSDVRKRAVFAISQLPREQSVPKLIELAKTHRDPEVRKQAMFWLGQSGDSRAADFFESVIKGR